MLSKSQAAALFLFCLLAYMPYLLTPTVGGWDSYYYLTLLQVPQNAFALVKLATFAALFSSTYFVACLGKLFDEKRGWLAGIFCFAALPWLMDFWKFETEQFAYPFLFASLYFFFKGNKLVAVGLLAMAFSLWQASALYLLPYALYSLWVAAPACVVAGYGFWKYRATLWFNLAVEENWPVFGVAYQLLLLPGLFYFPPKLVKAGSFFLLLAFINAKYAIHLTPFLAVGCVLMQKQAKWGSLKAMPFIGVATMLLIMSFPVAPRFWVANFPPTGQDFEAALVAVQEAKSETVFNDWSAGHVITFLGGKPLAKSGGKQPSIECSNCVLLTRKEMECECLYCKGELKTYKC